MTNEEFNKEFRNITRTETLSLPTFEEFRDMTFDFNYEFPFLPLDSDEFYYMKVIDTHTLVIYCQIGFDNFIFQEEFTKENYLKACEVCKKLFLEGE